MARPRRGKRRRRQGRDWLTDFLITGIRPEKDEPGINPFEVLHICYQHDRIQPCWESHRAAIMHNWNKPGCRPFAWWLFDAPRLPDDALRGAAKNGEFSEPRLHLGGPGQPVHEVLAFYPRQHFGLWSWFGDPARPPSFETQFQYLERHGLLLPDENEPLPEAHPAPDHIEDAAKWPTKSIKEYTP